MHIESIDYKGETYENLSSRRVEELRSDTMESEGSLITDELIYYHAYKSTTSSNYRDGIDEDQPPLFLALSALIPVDTLPSNNCKIIPTSIQLKCRRSPTDASITRYKARICARVDLLTRFMHALLEKTSPFTFNFVLQLSIIYGFHRTCVDVTNYWCISIIYQVYPFEQQPLAVTLQGEVCDILGIEKDQEASMLDIFMACQMLGKHIISHFQTTI
jgi:hypothetical protein